MSPKLQRHLIGIGAEIDPPPGAHFVYGIFGVLLMVIGLANFLEVPDPYYTLCALMLQLLLAYMAGLEIGMLLRLRKLSNSPQQRRQYIRELLSSPTRELFLAPPKEYIIETVEIILALAILLSRQEYLSTAFIVIGVMAMDHLFESHIDFVRRYIGEVEAS